jgi:hypothetical protein
MQNKPRMSLAYFSLEGRLLALRVARGMSAILSLSDHNRHWPKLTLDGSVAFDPERPIAASFRCGAARVSCAVRRFRLLALWDRDNSYLQHYPSPTGTGSFRASGVSRILLMPFGQQQCRGGWMILILCIWMRGYQ